jgi:hypothetical protein
LTWAVCWWNVPTTLITNDKHKRSLHVALADVAVQRSVTGNKKLLYFCKAGYIAFSKGRRTRTVKSRSNEGDHVSKRVRNQRMSYKDPKIS